MKDNNLPYKRRLTKQRKIILDILSKDYTHPTAEQVYIKVKKILPHISLGTIYRNLSFLSNIDLVKELKFPGQVSRFDGQKKEHDHFTCNICKNISDIPKYPLMDSHIKKYGKYSVGNFTLNYSGICKKCKNKKPCVKIFKK